MPPPTIIRDDEDSSARSSKLPPFPPPPPNLPPSLSFHPLTAIAVFILTIAWAASRHHQNDSDQGVLIQQALRQRAALLAPVLFPMLYPSCNRLTHPPVPLHLNEEARRVLSMSQCGEDLDLYDTVFHKYQDPQSGVFLEIGALDGRSLSNTWLYEHGLGWRGILVEPQPKNAAKLMKAHRPRSARFTMGVCSIDPTHDQPGALVFSAAGGPVATVRELASPSFLQQWSHLLGPGNVTVPCLPLQYIIDATGLWDIDLFSLDVEGGELAVLQTVDLSLTNIHVMLVEMDGHNQAKDQRVRAMLLDQGFVMLKEQDACHNTVFLNPSFHERKASRPPLPIKC